MVNREANDPAGSFGRIETLKLVRRHARIIHGVFASRCELNLFDSMKKQPRRRNRLLVCER